MPKLTEADDSKLYHRTKLNMVLLILQLLETEGYETMKKAVIKTQFKNVFDIIDDGMLPKKETRECIVRTFVTHYNDSAIMVNVEQITADKYIAKL